MGGIGKTTLAGAVFKQIAFQFEGCCFLSNIGKESQKCGGLTRLGEELLSKVLKERELKLNTPDIRSSHFKEMLHHNRVLIVLDDVNNIEQLEYFAGDPCWFGSGSRVFVTSRDKQLLSITVDVTYEVKELNYEDALHLICWNAFKQKSPLEDFVTLTHLVVRYARGNPLALKVLGSMLYGKSKTEWGSALKKLTRAPHKDIQDIMKFTYDNLDDEERDIFLHIACLFESEDRDRVTQALDGCGFSADIGISTLVDKSLLTISKNKLKMHDLLQEMGREIVRQESKRPSECNRLWNPDDIYKVLEENTGTEAIVGILLWMSEARKSELNRNAFTRISNLKFLILRMSNNCGGFEEECKVQFPKGLESLPQQLRYLYWHGYPLKFLPANFHPTNLIELNFPYSRLEGLWEGDKVINHGVPEKLMRSMIDACKGFFDLSEEEKQEYTGSHVLDPIRCGTSFNTSVEKVFCWRDFLKVFVHPVFHSPSKPVGLSDTMLEYSKRVKEVARELLKGISESLGLEADYIENALNFERGLQISIANYYPPCTEPELAMGLPCHSDHGLLTLLIENGVSGLQVQHKGKWVNLNSIPNSFLVNTGDHLEILSNGKFKSILHRAVVNKNNTRISIAMAHGPSLDTVVSPAPELLDRESKAPAYIGIKYEEYVNLQQSNKLDGKSCLDRVRI